MEPGQISQILIENLHYFVEGAEMFVKEVLGSLLPIILGNWNPIPTIVLVALAALGVLLRRIRRGDIWL